MQLNAIPIRSIIEVKNSKGECVLPEYKIIQVCKFCGEIIANDSELFKLYTNGPTLYSHRKCAINEGYENANNESGTYLSNTTKNKYNIKTPKNSNEKMPNSVKIFIGFNQPVEVKKFEDMTNKEMQEFQEWKAKEDQKKWENEKAIK